MAANTSTQNVVYRNYYRVIVEIVLNTQSPLHEWSGYKGCRVLYKDSMCANTPLVTLTQEENSNNHLGTERERDHKHSANSSR